MSAYLQNVPVRACFSKATFAAGTTTTTSYAATNYAIDGKMYAVSAGSNSTTPTTDANTGKAFTTIAIGEAGLFVFGFSKAGALKCVQGSIVKLDAQGNISKPMDFPAIPDDFCPCAYEIVKIASNGSAWTMGASNQAAQTGITKTFQDLATLPSRPVTA